MPETPKPREPRIKHPQLNAHQEDVLNRRIRALNYPTDKNELPYEVAEYVLKKMQLPLKAGDITNVKPVE